MIKYKYFKEERLSRFMFVSEVANTDSLIVYILNEFSDNKFNKCVIQIELIHYIHKDNKITVRSTWSEIHTYPFDFYKVTEGLDLDSHDEGFLNVYDTEERTDLSNKW